MSAEEIVTAIQRLPPVERDKVIEFARDRLQGQFTGEPSHRRAGSLDGQEKAALQEEVMHRFHGNVAPLA